jgi:hypothetical protein
VSHRPVSFVCRWSASAKRPAYVGSPVKARQREPVDGAHGTGERCRDSRRDRLGAMPCPARPDNLPTARQVATPSARCRAFAARNSPPPPDQIAAPPAVLPLRAVAANRLTNAALCRWTRLRGRRASCGARFVCQLNRAAPESFRRERATSRARDVRACAQADRRGKPTGRVTRGRRASRRRAAVRARRADLTM